MKNGISRRLAFATVFLLLPVVLKVWGSKVIAVNAVSGELIWEI